MHVWVIVAVWGFALALAAVVLGFAAYEVIWKARRLEREQRRLAELVVKLSAVTTDLQAAGERAGELRARIQD